MTTIAPALRLLAAVRAGAVLASRPRGVAHLYSGPLTPSGRYLPSSARTVCRARTRRLQVLQRDVSALGPGRRVCRRCMGLCPPRLGAEVRRLVSRDEWAAAYGHLDVEDLVLAARWAMSVDQLHQVGLVASIVLGTAGKKPVDEILLARRPKLVVAERTPQEQADVEARRADQLERDAQIQAARRKQVAIEKAVDRRNRGVYLTPHERQLVAS